MLTHERLFFDKCWYECNHQADGPCMIIGRVAPQQGHIVASTKATAILYLY